MSEQSAIVIGAGIGGIAAAYRLQKAGLKVTVYDRADFIGGRMKSVEREGFNIDVGAGLLPGAYVDVKELLEEAGLNHLKEEVTGNCAFMRDGQAHMINLGNMQMGMAFTKLIGWRTKFAMLKLVALLAKNRDKLSFTDMGQSADIDTETVTEYCERELPREALDYLLGPFVRTMFLQPPEQASIAELLWSMKNLTGSAFSLKGGMDSLVKNLADGLDVRLGTSIRRVTDKGDGVEVVIEDAEGKRIETADYCVIASDGQALLNVYGEGLTERQKNYLEKLQYSTDHVVSFALNREPAIDATLVQVPEAMDAELAALVIDNKKGSGRAPAGKGMVTCHFLDTWGQRMAGKPDEEIIEAARGSVAKVIPEVADCVDFANIETWERAATMSEAGTYKLLSGFMADVDSGARVQLCGDYMSLSSVNVSVATSKVTVNNILTSIRKD